MEIPIQADSADDHEDPTRRISVEGTYLAGYRSDSARSSATGHFTVSVKVMSVN